MAWVPATNIAADLTCWTRLLGLHEEPELANAEVDTLRFRLWHIPANWPWARAFQTCWTRLTALPAPD